MWNLALIGQLVSEKMMFENYGYIHIYSPGTGADNPPEVIYFINSIIQSILSFAASVPQLNHFITVFPIQTYI